jgi:uncharacterized protein YndB with AHSA1/START domain
MGNRTEFKVDKSRNEVVITRVFNAPREKVFDTIMDPGLVPQWWGQKAYKTVVDKMDVKVGGKWRYVQSDPTGKEFPFSGEYKEIKRPEKIVYSFEYEAMPGHGEIDTVKLENVGGKTKMVQTGKFSKLEDMEGKLSMGMEWGSRELIERLAELVEK